MVSPQEENGKELKRFLPAAVRKLITDYTVANPVRSHIYQKTDSRIAVRTITDEKTITPELTQIAELISNFPPDDVVDIIFSDPPDVVADITDTTEPENLKNLKTGSIIPIPAETAQSDKEYAERPVYISNIGDSNTLSLVANLVEACRAFLISPLVNRDHFENHEERRLYEEGVKSALELVGQKLPKNESNKWSDAFKNRWDNHRYTKNRQTAIMGYYEAILDRLYDGKTLPNGFVEQLVPFFSRFTEEITQAKKFLKDKKNRQPENSYPTAYKVSRAVIEFFSDQENPASTEKKRKIIPDYIRDFWGDLPFINREDLINLYPLIELFVQYGSTDLHLILNKIMAVPMSEKGEKSPDDNEIKIQQAVFKVFKKSLMFPNVSGTAYRKNFSWDMNLASEKDEKRAQFKVPPPIPIDSEVEKQAKEVIDKLTLKIIRGQNDSNALLGQVFHKRDSGEPITTEYLKSNSKLTQLLVK